MKGLRPLVAAIVLLGLSVSYAQGQLRKTLTNHNVRINEVMAGLNGNSRIQFIEMVASDCGQKNWGPQGTEKAGRAMLVFFDAAGNQTGRFVVPEDPPGSCTAISSPPCASLPNSPKSGPANTVLFATQAFKDLTGITPDFIIPEGIIPNAGKICFKGNSDSNDASCPESLDFDINLCLSYGGTAFTGSTEGAGAANSAVLSILGSQSLRRTTNFSFGDNPSFGSNFNSNFALGTPTPNSTQNNVTGVTTNAVGQAGLPGASSTVDQGKTLFLKERFLGNGRTCGTCHLESESFGLTPVKVASLLSTDPTNPLFVNQVNVNTIVVNSAGSVNPTAISGTSQPSDFFLGSTITGSLSGSATATVLAGTGKTYLILGGSSLNIPGNVISDPFGNKGTLVSFTPGNLNGPNPVNDETRGLEDTGFLTGGRALITENINGFDKKTFMRESPNLLNIKHTGPFGLSGGITTLQAFAAGAVEQHFTRSLLRVAGTDFRLPTTAERDAMAAFMETINLPADEDFDEANNFDKFVTTEAQKRGRTLFFGEAKCNVCHSGKVLATSNGQFGTTTGVNEAFNTGVVNLPINTIDGLPTEEDMGQPPNTRKFSTRPLFGVKNTAPFFHDNSVPTLLDAIQFYDSQFFRDSPASAQIEGIEVVGILQNAKDIQAFLEGLVELPFTFTRTLNLGSQNVNEGPTTAMTVTLTNTGTEAISITNLTLNGANPGEFANGAPTPNSGPFSTGQSRTLNVTFDPSSAGAKQATLEMRLANSIDSWDVGVALSGTGVGTVCVSNGDVNNSGTLTPGDALCAFKIFLNGQSVPADCDVANFDCEVAAGDVNCNNTTTPGDALAIFQRFLNGLPPAPCFGASAAPKLGMSVNPYTLSLHQSKVIPSVETAGNELVKVSLKVDKPEGLQAFGLKVSYPAHKLDFIGVQRTALTAKWRQLDGKSKTPGEVIIGGFNDVSLSATAAGEVFVILFAVKGRHPSLAEFEISQLVDGFSKALVKRSESDPQNVGVIPQAFKLYQSFPNPFPSGALGNETMIRFDLPGPEALKLELTIYNLAGQVVRQLISDTQPPGAYEISWDGKDEQARPVPTGTYLYQLKVGNLTETRRLTIVR
jgi:cytochrome c peroxidase